MPELIVESKTYGEHKILFDECDIELIESHNWQIKKCVNTFYAQAHIPHPDGGWYIRACSKTGKIKRGRRRTTLKLHRLIMKPSKGMMVDHINGDGLDNRRENLRVCTHAENQRNARRRNDNKSGSKGVSWNKNAKKWRSQIRHEGKVRHIGLFESREEAARAWDAKAKEYHGKYAQLNFPEE